MKLALTSEEYGYYANQNPFGVDGDFITAPEISQMFGEIVAAWIIDKLLSVEANNTRFQLIELGAGRGTLLADCLRIISKFSSIAQKLDVIIIEASNQLIQVQKDRLSKYSGFNIRWQNNLDNLKNHFTLFIANEFFDALPIQQYQKIENQWYERIVVYNNKTDLLEFGLSKDKANIAADIQADFFEKSEESIAIMNLICEQIKQNHGAALIFDYGYFAGYADTLQAVKAHKFHPVLQDVGKADITAHVNFGALNKVAEDKGLLSRLATQRDFLIANGILIRAEKLMLQANDAQKEQIKSALHRLISVEEMGELFKVIEISN